MRDASFTNYIERQGQEVRIDELSKSERERIAILSADRFMEAAGFKRKNA